jgi:diketogulonate reductase-like aldo/keto reductase
VLRRAVELGIRLIDTADSYGPKVSERFIAEALHPYPNDLVIATKAGFQRPNVKHLEENTAAALLDLDDSIMGELERQPAANETQ